MHIYGELLVAMFIDQVKYIFDKKHKRKITEENGRASLAMAVEAEEKSVRYSEIPKI